MKNLVLPVIALLVGLTIGYFIHGPKPTDQSKAAAWDKLFSAPTLTTAKVAQFGQGGSHRSPLDQPICHTIALECADAYKAMYEKPDAANLQAMADAYTDTMVFGSANLKDWLEDITSHTDVVSIKVKLGIYSGSILTQFPGQVEKGRVMAFFYPVAANGKSAVYLKNSPSHYMFPAGTKDCKGNTYTSAKEGDTTFVYDFAGIEP